MRKRDGNLRGLFEFPVEFRSLKMTVVADKELKDTALDKLHMLSFIGRMACVTGLSIVLLVLIPQPLIERSKVLLGGVTVLSIGAAMLYFNWRAKKQARAAEKKV